MSETDTTTTTPPADNAPTSAPLPISSDVDAARATLDEKIRDHRDALDNLTAAEKDLTDDEALTATAGRELHDAIDGYVQAVEAHVTDVDNRADTDTGVIAAAPVEPAPASSAAAADAAVDDEHGGKSVGVDGTPVAL